MSILEIVALAVLGIGVLFLVIRVGLFELLGVLLEAIFGGGSGGYGGGGGDSGGSGFGGGDSGGGGSSGDF